ncbi:hypothetical protein JOF56_010363 [Kibdelosporangium banguiense]|uniref:Uncharacterized protein n=1 Tax=Kibdelosporangium banguiense TaxID=1365924 RepID=A0ABS4U170_9PSEU|nr:hypothetical protein [Kibdelosporangium banguiense]MBP2329978.1 hypothetical protein [Kibdelosporangium banguiense]
MRFVLPAVSALLALLVLTPLLGRGFVLNYDMVFAPAQPLVPDSLGLGSAVPRSVPADAVMSLFTAILPGDIVQKIILFLALMMGPWGAGRLVPANAMPIRVVAAVWYGWSAYLAERLFMGHWPYLVAYACLPWIASAGLAVRRAEPKALPKLILACAPAVITPTGGILAAGMALVCAGRQALVVTAPAMVALNAPWWVPSILQSTLSSPDGISAFTARAENWATPVLSVLSTGGIWNAEVVPGSREMPLLPVFTLFALLVVFIGLQSATEKWLRGLLLLGAAGVVIAVFGTLPGGDVALRWAVEHIPGAGLLRDSQKYAAWWALPMAIGFALGVQVASKYLTNRIALITVASLLPLVTMPDFAWAGFNRLATTAYPSDWTAVADLLRRDRQTGDVVALPLSAFRRFPWNDNRTQLDPAPRILPRTVITDDTVVVGGRPIAGEDARAQQVRRTVEENENLAAMGIGWVLVEHQTPGRIDQAVLQRLQPVWQGEWLTLYRVPGMLARAPAGPPRLPVLAGDLLALTVVTGALLWLVLPAGRFRLRNRTRTAEE